MGLTKEIDDARKTIQTDGYAMSVGELANLYRDGELDIHPEFQRLFRWEDPQKSRFIESILLGIPIPSIFVAQRDDGIWDVVDGLQRLSTIFQLTGDLKDENKQPVDPLVLTGTKYLPSLEGYRWGEDSEGNNILSDAQRLLIKRAKIDVKIILRESDPSSQYELFQRLNTGGSQLSDQELRNCILITVDREFYRWVERLAEFDSFQATVCTTERLKRQQYNMELVTRFLVFHNQKEVGTRIRDLSEYLTEESVSIAKHADYDRKKTERVFHHTFELLNGSLGEDSFRRYDAQKQGHAGAFSISLYETIAFGLGFHYEGWASMPDASNRIREIVQHIGEDADFIKNTGGGVNASSRIRHTLRIGRERFKP